MITSGCAGSPDSTSAGQLPDSQPETPALELALPVEVMKAASLVDADRFCYGADYASELPSQRLRRRALS